MKIDINIITKLSEDKFFNLIESMREYVSDELKPKLRINVCYTGDNPSELQRIDQSLIGFEHHTIQRPYHFSKNANELATMYESDYTVFLNDDVEFVMENTLEYMLEYAEDHDYGIVGLKLLYPDGKIQHYGQAVLVDGEANFKGITHYGWRCIGDVTDQDIPTQGVTAACCMLRRDDFDKIGGFNENYNRAFQDVELCWRIRLLGYLSVCVGWRYALHYESLTRGKNDFDKSDVDIMEKFWNDNKEDLNEHIYIDRGTICRIQ